MDVNATTGIPEKDDSPKREFSTFEPPKAVKKDKPRVATAAEKEAFMRENEAYATSMGARMGVDPKKLLTMAALESGYGTANAGSYNIFGIKGKGTISATHEYDSSGKLYATKDSFKNFDSPADSWKGFEKTLSLKRYKQAFDPEKDFFKEIERGGYAGKDNTTYASRLRATYHSKAIGGYDPNNTQIASREESKIEKATKKIKQSFAEVNPTALGVGGAILGTVAASAIAPKTSSASMFNSVASGSARVENQQLPTINEPSTRTASTAPVIKENGAIDINATRMRQETLNFQTKVLKYLKNIADKLTNGRGSFDFGSNSDERSSIFSGKNNLGGNIGAALGNLAAPVLGTLGVAGGAFLGNLAGGAVGMAARGTMALGGAVASGIAGTSALGVLGPIGAAAAGGYSLYQGIEKQREIRLETDPKKKQALKDKLDWYNKPIVEFDSNKVPRALYNGQQHLKRGLYSGQEKIKEVGGEALDYTKGILESIKKSINAKGKELEKGIDNTITSMKETISQTILGIGTSISNAIKGAVDGAINAIKAPFTPTQAEQNKLQGKTSEGVKVDQGNKSNPAPQPDNIPRDKSGRPINAPANTPIDKSGRPINAPANTPIDKSGRPINAPKIVPASSAIIPKATSQTTEQLTVAHQAANNLIQKKEDSSPTIINNYNSTTSNKDGSGGDTTSRIFVTNRDSTQMGLQFISNISGAGALQQ